MYLSLPVDTDDSACAFMGSCDKDGVTANAVHVDTGGRLKVIQVNVPILGDEKDHVVFFTHL